MTLAAPMVSIVIPFYNCPYVAQAIESALCQTCSDCEIIVVDDGSTRHMELLTPFLQQCTVVRKRNGGTASALNAGIQRATGQYFAWLSSDDVFAPTKIERQLAFMLGNHAYVSHTAYQTIDEDSRLVGDPIRLRFPGKRSFYQTLLQGCPINGSSIMLRMEVFSSLGYFDEALLYTHDYDMWLRMIPHYEFYYLEDPLLMYRSHAKMGTKVHEQNIALEIASVQVRRRQSIQRLIQEEIF